MKAFVYPEKHGDGVHPSGFGWCVRNLADNKAHHLPGVGGTDEEAQQAAIAAAAELLKIDAKDIEVQK